MRTWRLTGPSALLWLSLTLTSLGSGCCTSSPLAPTYPPLPANRPAPVAQEDLMAWRSRGDWAAAAAAIKERDNYVGALERDGLWAREEED